MLPFTPHHEHRLCHLSLQLMPASCCPQHLQNLHIEYYQADHDAGAGAATCAAAWAEIIPAFNIGAISPLTSPRARGRLPNFASSLASTSLLLYTLFHFISPAEVLKFSFIPVSFPSC